MKNKKFYLYLFIFNIILFALISCNIKSPLKSIEVLGEQPRDLQGEPKNLDIKSVENKNEDNLFFTGENLYKNFKINYNTNNTELNDMFAELIIPIEWELISPTIYDDIELLLSVNYIYKNNERIGWTGYYSYQIYYEAEDNYRSIFTDLMVSNHYNWDNNFNWIKKDDSSGTAVCKIYKTLFENGKTAAESQIIYNSGILSYSKNLMRYIFIEIYEGFITDEEVQSIAESIKLFAINK